MLLPPPAPIIDGPAIIAEPRLPSIPINPLAAPDAACSRAA